MQTADSLPEVDILCLLGLPPTQMYGVFRQWLDRGLNKRLLIVEDRPQNWGDLAAAPDEFLLTKDNRIRLYFLEAVITKELVAQEIAWRLAFTSSCFLSNSPTLGDFQLQVENLRAVAELTLSDASDRGVALFKNLLAHRGAFRNGFSLKGAFQGVPAILCGAGPSLERNGLQLRDYGDRALILAGGEAAPILQEWGITPHFSASIDPRTPPAQFGRQLFWEVPLLFQRRMRGENGRFHQGERILFPDHHFSFEAHLSGFGELWQGGWTVGTFLFTAAVLMGCDPIIWVGMDCALPEGQKYAGGEKKDPAAQADFLMAARWIEAFVKEHPERRWINATEGGALLSGSIHTCSLREAMIDYTQMYDLSGMLHQTLQLLPYAPAIENKLSLWTKSLERCLQEIDPKEEVYQLLLEPLWQIWSPIFLRAAEMDGMPISLEEKLELHKRLFFQQIIRDHQACIV